MRSRITETMMQFDAKDLDGFGSDILEWNIPERDSF